LRDTALSELDFVPITYRDRQNAAKWGATWEKRRARRYAMDEDEN
jgi:hypothetical protein